MTDTHTDNEELAKTERIILDIIQTQSTYDPAVFPSDEHFTAARIARHVHHYFDLKPTAQAAVQGDMCAGCGAKPDELHLPLQHELNKERHAIQPTKSSGELEELYDLLGGLRAEIVHIMVTGKQAPAGSRMSGLSVDELVKVRLIMEAIATQTTKLQAEARIDEVKRFPVMLTLYGRDRLAQLEREHKIGREAR